MIIPFTSIKKYTTRFIASMCAMLVMVSLVAPTPVLSVSPTINYQGKLTNASNVAVPNGTYNMRFWLLTSPTIATTSAIWTESLTGSNRVQVTNGLFSVMLGSTTPLTGVNFNQTLYLGVEIGGTSTPAWDGEMSPRKLLGTVPAAFVASDAVTFSGIATTSFLRSDQVDTATSLLTFTGGLLSTASTTITNLTAGIATATTLVINNQAFTNLLGAGLSNQSGALTVATSSLGLVTSVGASVPTGLTVSGSPITTSGTLAFGWDTGYSPVLTASTTNWNSFFNTPSTRITAANNLAWTGNTLGVAAGYSIPLTASSTDWQSFYTTPSTRISDGTGLTWSGNTLNCDTATGAAQGCLTAADWTLFNNKVSSTSIDTSAELANLLTDETGTAGNLVFSTNPLLAGFRSNASSTIGGGTDQTGLTISGGATTTGRALFSGNVGIGTGTPMSLLSLSAVDPIITLRDTGSNRTYQLRNGTINGQFDIFDQTSNAARLSISSGGDVAIGTTSPVSGSTLFVYSTNAANLATRPSSALNGSLIEVQAHDYDTSFQSVYLQYSGSGSIGNVFGSVPNADLGRLVFSGASNAAIYTVDSAPLIFGTNNSEVARFSGGNLGLGTTSPAARLDITGVAGGADIFRISSSTNARLLTVTAAGNLGIGTTSPAFPLAVAGDVNITGALRFGGNAGTSGFVLQSTGTGAQWVATSTLGISGGASTFLALTDTPSSYTANRVFFTNGGGTAVTDSANLVFTGTNLGVGSTTPNFRLSVSGTAAADSFFSASTTASSTLLHTLNIGPTNLSHGNPGALNIRSLGSNTSIGFLNDSLGEAVLVFNNSTHGLALETIGSIPISLRPNNGAGIQINGSGNTGIGTTSLASGARLTVEGSVNIRGNATTSGNASFGGLVGIGSTTPSQALTVSGTSSLRTVLPEATLTYDLGTTTRRWNQTWTNILNLGTSTWSMTQSAGARFSLFDAASGGGNERLTVLANGNVGISTSSPAARLDITGSGSGPIFAISSSTNARLLTMTAAGRLGLGSGHTNPTALLSLKDNVTINGIPLAADSSDINDQDNILDISSQYNFGLSDTPYFFTKSVASSSLIVTGELANYDSFFTNRELTITADQKEMDVTGVIIGDQDTADTAYHTFAAQTIRMRGGLSFADTFGGSPHQTYVYGINARVDSNFSDSSMGFVDTGSYTSAGGRFENSGFPTQTASKLSSAVTMGIQAVNNVNPASAANMTKIGGSFEVGNATNGTSIGLRSDIIGGGSGANYGAQFTVVGGSLAVGLTVSAGSATQNRAIQINSPSVGTNNYAIYSTATARSYFAGNLGIGSTTASQLLTVAGTSSLRNVLPEATLTYDLGTSTRRWNQTWTNILNLGTSTWSMTQSAGGRFSLFDDGGAAGTERLAIFTGTSSRMEFAGDVVSSGISWTSRTSASSSAWSSVAYGNGLFVAVARTDGTTNNVMTSPDGINWRMGTSSQTGVVWNSITYGNGLFVAVGEDINGGKDWAIMYSSDGITWTPVAPPSELYQIWNSVTYGNGLFVAVAESGTGNRIMTSPNGIDWTHRTSPADNAWISVTYGNGRFVAVAYSGTNRVMTSVDGINWSTQSVSSNIWAGVTYGNGLFVAVACGVGGLSCNDTSGDRVMTSPDGITWTNRTDAADNRWRGLAYGNGLFVTTSLSGTGNRVMTSPDGITWTTRTSAANNDWGGLAFGNGTFVAVSDTGSNDRVMTSGKMSNQSLVTNNLFQGGMNIMGRVGVGTTSPQTALHVQISSDGAPVRFQDISGYCEINPISTTWSCTSDQRLKENIESLDGPSILENLERLRPVSFAWINDATHGERIGLIAQEVEEVFPDLVNTDRATGLKSVAYGGLTPYLLSGVKELASSASTTNNALAALLITGSSTFASTSPFAALLGEEDTIWSRLVELAQNFVDGVLTIAGIRTNELCVGEVCVDEATFLRMVEQSGGTPLPPSGGGTTTPPEEPVVGDDTEPTSEPESSEGGSGVGDETPTEPEAPVAPEESADTASAEAGSSTQGVGAGDTSDADASDGGEASDLGSDAGAGGDAGATP